MKKKIFSALLMGVFTLASMSMFVSCKDYDDDINNLDAEQQTLLSQLQALEKTVNDNQASVSTQLTEAVEKANQALQGVQGLEGTVSEVESTAKAAGEAAAAAQTSANGAQEAAEAAQKTADDALETAKKALEALGVTGEGTSLVDQVADLAKRLGNLETLAAGIPELVAKIEDAATKEELDAVKSEVQKYQDYFDSIFAMVTSVELYATVGHNAAEGLGTKMLNIRYGKMAATENFGNNEAVGLDEKVYATATPEKSYTKDGEILDFDDYFIVRVNPINAKFTKDDVKIINSLGKDLSGIVEIKDVKQWDELLTRAGETANNGLWKVTVKRAEGVSEAAYKDAVQSDNKNILFAVAINNTGKDETADRYVASTFDMTINPEADYEPVTSLDFYVGKFNVDELKNRWSIDDATGKCVAVGEDGTSLNEGLKEYKWTSASLAVFDENKVSIDEADARFNDRDYYPAEVGEKFTIDLSKVKGNEDVQWYYVTLDENFANVKSSPSELNAWQSYDYVGLYTMTAASDKLDITVNNPTDKDIDAYGDVIGFRVFAVNYDGTLVDPDGKAFYIKLGDATNKQKKDVKITVTTPGANESGYIDIDKFLPFRGSCTNVATSIDPDASDEMASGAAITFSLYKDKNGTPATDWTDAKCVKVKFNAANMFEDGGTFVATAEVKDGNRTVNTLTLNVTKVMPTPETIAGKFAFNATQLVNNVYTCYLDPEVNWSTASNTGNKDLSSVAVMGKFNTADYYTWVFENATIKNNQPAALEVKDNKLSVNKAFINDDEHATAIYYTFDDLSYAKNSSGSYEVGDYAVEAKTCTTVFACTFSKPVFDYAWKQAEVKDDDNKVIGKRDINYVVWGSNKWDEKVDNYANWIIGTSKVNNGVYGGTFMDTYAKNFVSVSARLYSNETGKEDYYTVTWMGSATTPYFAFTPVAGKENPTTDVASTLEITVIDAFGHKTVYPLPFTIKKQ